MKIQVKFYKGTLAITKWLIPVAITDETLSETMLNGNTGGENVKVFLIYR